MARTPTSTDGTHALAPARGIGMALTFALTAFWAPVAVALWWMLG